MVARFVDVNNLSWQRRPYDFRTMEEKYGLTFCSWVQSWCTGKSYISIIFYLSAIFAGPRFYWDPDILLPWFFIKRIAFRGKKFCFAGIMNCWFSALAGWLYLSSVICMLFYSLIQLLTSHRSRTPGVCLCRFQSF